MKGIREILAAVACCLLLCLQGCGGTSTATDIFDQSPTHTNLLGYKLTVKTDRQSVDENIGQVLATATVVDAAGQPVPDLPVDFVVRAGPASVSSNAVPSTDNSGVAVAVIETGDAQSTTNVIVEASIGDGAIKALTTFQLVRGSGILTMSPTAEAEYTAPAGALPGTVYGLLQQIPFTLTDSNGNPRVGVRVTIRVYSALPGDTPVLFTSGQNTETVITDADGKGIFNTEVLLQAPGPGGVNSASVVFRGETEDGDPLVGYGGTMYILKQDKEGA